ncbi:lectin B isoform 3 [Penaeus vannamei]|uniref:Lectin B isoform 3 n=1 Tax=Penaeus vannamei TaxID=6689 RepID=A0A3R7PQG4_PENVA|nr:lectin B isoform 3 [Penaeus vannamei]
MAWTYRHHTCPYNQPCPTNYLNSKESLINNLMYEENRLSRLTPAERRSPDVLRGTVHLLTDIRAYLTYSQEAGRAGSSRGKKAQVACPEKFVNAGGICLYIEKHRSMDWDKARTFCQEMGGDLAIFRDANEFAGALDLIREHKSTRLSWVWIGGSDRDEEGNWKWFTGEPMPMGTPFWGSVRHRREPRQDRAKEVNDCAILYENDDYMIHDRSCSWGCKPLCQFHFS